MLPSRLLTLALLAGVAWGDDSCHSAPELCAEDAVLLQIAAGDAQEHRPGLLQAVAGRLAPILKQHPEKTSDPRMLWAVQAEKEADAVMAKSMKLWLQSDGAMKVVQKDMAKFAAYATEQAIKLGRAVGLQRVAQSTLEKDEKKGTDSEGASLLEFEEAPKDEDQNIETWQATAEGKKQEINAKIRKAWTTTYQALAKVQVDSKSTASWAWNNTKAFNKLMRWMIFASSPDARKSVVVKMANQTMQLLKGDPEMDVANLLQVADHPSVKKVSELAQSKEGKHLDQLLRGQDPMEFWKRAVNTNDEAKQDGNELFKLTVAALERLKKGATDRADWAQSTWAKVHDAILGEDESASSKSSAGVSRSLAKVQGASSFAQDSEALQPWGSFVQVSAENHHHRKVPVPGAGLAKDILKSATDGATKSYIEAAQGKAEAEATRDMFLAMAQVTFSTITETAEKHASWASGALEEVNAANAARFSQ